MSRTITTTNSVAGYNGGPLQASTAATRLSKALAVLDSWFDRWLQRRQLADLPEEALRDIGVTAETAAAEAAKPFWRP